MTGIDVNRTLVLYADEAGGRKGERLTIMRIVVVWEPYPDTQFDEDGYQDLRQVIRRDDFRLIDDDDFDKLIGKCIKDVRRSRRDEIVFELEEGKENEDGSP